MAKLVFDIETSALPHDHLDEFQLEYLFRDAEAIEDEAAKQARKEEIARLFNLWPFTSQVVCVGMLNADSGKGQVLFVADDFEELGNDPSVKYSPCFDESEILSTFWEVATHYDRIVTFNGRSFDIPFLYLRSALLKVPITKKNWLGYRFSTDPHCDLAEQLTFYNVSGRDGAARRFTLDFYCRAFGIESPKSQGVTGKDMNQLIQEGRYREIADYCMRDVRATAELFRIWSERLEGIK